MNAIVEATRAIFMTGKTKSVAFRKKQLQALLRLLEENTTEMLQALKVDLNKGTYETLLMEIKMIKNDLVEFIANLESWAKPKRPAKALATMLDDLYIIHEPYGVVLIIGSWNYPLQLLLLPVVGAIAAGNCVIIKPSEVAVATADFIRKTIPKYLDSDCYKVVCGGAAETSELLKERFDYIFYTGSTAVGRLVHKAANKYLTPVTLEMGGKSPVYIDDSSDIKIAAKRLLWGKFVNAGQTCIAPDYLLCSERVEQQLLEVAPAILESFFGKDPQQSVDLGRIIHEKSFARLARLIQSGEVAVGGILDAKDLYISPTILSGVRPEDAIMQEEIFGPILPIVRVNSHREAIDFINSGERPLAMYLFAANDQVNWQFLNDVSCGGVSVNDTLMHFTVDVFPFGGVGQSGMGHYHGKYSFDTFTHQKPCLYKSFNKIGEAIAACRYPPYTESKRKFLEFLLTKRQSVRFAYISQVLAFALGLITAYCYQNGTFARFFK